MRITSQMVAVTSQGVVSEQYFLQVLCGRGATHPGFPRTVPLDAYCPGIFTAPFHSQKSPPSTTRCMVSLPATLSIPSSGPAYVSSFITHSPFPSKRPWLGMQLGGFLFPSL